jgi:Zn-dependent oligopeptidase
LFFPGAHVPDEKFHNFSVSDSVQKFQIFILNRESSTSITGDSTHVTVHNVMLYLDIIERRTNDLINVVYHLEQNMPVMQKHIMEDHPGMLHPVPVDKMVPTNSCSQ